MTFLLVFSGLLLTAVLVSQWSARSILSSTVLFLAAGILCSRAALGVIAFDPGDPVVSTLAEVALFSVLFTEGAKIKLADLCSAWRLPGRALLLGMPLFFAATCLLARLVLEFDWPRSCLLAAVLSPTDPVFAAAVVGRKEVPFRVRHLLNVESGVNDGLALPAVVLLLELYGGESTSPAVLAARLASGLGIGAATALVASWLERVPVFGAASQHRPLFGLAVGLLIFALSKAAGANEYLAAFAGGIGLANAHRGLSADFSGLGQQLTESLKLAAVLAFASLLSPELIGQLSGRDCLFALLALLAVRPVVIPIVLWRSQLDWRERLVAGWFGPKGFASVVYGVMVFRSSVPDGERLFMIISLVIAGSMVVHSSTDHLVVRWFDRNEQPPPG